MIYDNRDALAEALMGLFAVKITDIVDWKDGKVVVKNPETIPEHALAAIKKSPCAHLIERVANMLAGDQLVLNIEMPEDNR